MTIIEKKFGKNCYSVTRIVDREQAGMRLDQYMQLFLTSFSRQTIKKKIDKSEIVILNRPESKKPSSKLFFNDSVKMVVINDEHETEYWNGEKLEVQYTPEIIYEDDDLIAISKPPFMATHPTGKHLFNCATVHFEAIYNKTIHSIHRLDRETSGVMLLGKTVALTNTITEHFENSRIKKCYFFISRITKETASIKSGTSFTAKERLDSHEKGLERVYIKALPESSPKGKHATTFFKILYIEKGYALGLAFPETGRQHQIRVHAAHHGLPLIGDKIYLGGFKMFQRFKDLLATKEDHDLMELPRHALHALALKLPYKKQDNKIFLADIPLDLQKWINKNLSLEMVDLQEIINKNLNHF